MTLATVYVVDNCILARIAYKRRLQKNNYEIIGDFNCAEDCINAMKKRQADIIIMDVELPTINGIEATKVIKQSFPKVKVVITTVQRNEHLIMGALACGACGYIIKDKKYIKINQVIDAVLNGVFWIDHETAKLAFSAIPRPSAKNLDNIYQKNLLKCNLTQRELEVLKLMIDGKTNSQIAREIIVSTNTAKAHVGSILTKLSVKDRVQAAVMAVRANLF